MKQYTGNFYSMMHIDSRQKKRLEHDVELYSLPSVIMGGSIPN